MRDNFRARNVVKCKYMVTPNKYNKDKIYLNIENIYIYYSYRARHLLKRHFDVTHLKRSAKICAVCGKSCDTSNELRTHMTRHEPQTPVNCDVCGIRLTNKRNYLIHRRVQHPEGGKKDHPCHICNKISPTHRALMNHINIIHKKGYDHKCSVCGKAFKISARLRVCVIILIT